MRSLLLALTCVAILGVTAYLGARAPAETVKVKLRLTDADTGKDTAGIVRVFLGDDRRPLTLSGAFDRIRGLGRSDDVAGWYVVPSGGVEVTLPRGKLRLESLSGLETAPARRDLDLGAAAPEEVKVPLKYLFRPDEDGLAAGNTHLHLRGLSLEEAGEYLRQIPPADGLKVLFVSYLERHKDDETYITNRYSVGDLKQFDATGVLVSNGEEHRHNFEAFGQGYGHVMFLGIKELVKPVSLGPGITAAGDDDRPLRPGIDAARKQGGTVIWCHNTLGHEDVPSALAGRLDALNVFDGSRTGSFEDNYYRYLNVGLRLPISTGTDWFLYDFSRVYARPEGKLTVKGWLDAVKAGRCSVTNGPLLTLTVDGRGPGDVLELDRVRKVRAEVKAVGRHDFGRLELVHNGKVAASAEAKRDGDGFTARLSREVTADTPGWLAARIDTKTKNELGGQLYAHTSPVYLRLAGRDAFDVEAARALLRQMEEARADVRARGRFSGDAARDKLLTLYDEAAEELTRRVNQRGAK